MTLKIIGAGFGRTGTLSTYAALNQLGFPCYHMTEVIGNKKNRTHVNFWLKVANAPAGTQHDWEEVFADYTAAVDNPAGCAWRELASAYPDAKVVLTLHSKGADAWYESTMSTIYRIGRLWQLKLLAMFVPRLRKFSEMTRKLVWERTHSGEIEDRAKAIAQYERRIAEVKQAIAPDRLLIFSADQGWQPLCKFLGVPIPSAPFPNVNDRATMQKTIATIRAAGYGIIAVLIVLLVAMVYGASKLF